MTHICVSDLNIIGSDNGLSPGRRQAIIWTNAGILKTWILGKDNNAWCLLIYTLSIPWWSCSVSLSSLEPCTCVSHQYVAWCMACCMYNYIFVLSLHLWGPNMTQLYIFNFLFVVCNVNCVVIYIADADELATQRRRSSTIIIYIYMYVYIYLYAYICVFIYVYMYRCVYMPANACYHVYMIICMFSMCAHIIYADFMMSFLPMVAWSEMT